MSLMAHPFRPSLVYFFFAAFLCIGLPLRAQNFVVFDNLEQLQARINRAGDTTILVNFWATWCKPCVEELPCFDELSEIYGTQNIQILLVSLDFKSQLQKKFIPFLKNQRLKSEVALMADQDLNAWIPSLYEAWDGAIPATIIFKGKNRRFNLGKFENLEELEAFVRPFVSDSASMFVRNQFPCAELSGGKK